MKRVSVRSVVLALAALSAGSACAETYTAKVYTVPGGFARMWTTGAGDNGLLGGMLDTGLGVHAAYLTNSGYKDMNPAGFESSVIRSSWSNTYHCGDGTLTNGGPTRALYWLGGGAGVNLHPAGAEYTSSQAISGGGQLQAGVVYGSIFCAECGGITVNKHACCWMKTAASFKRLHSTTHRNTVANGTDGTRFVGWGENPADSSVNALMWNSSNSMAVNIRPSQSVFSNAYAMDTLQQVGTFSAPSTGLALHACVWSGTAASAVDLNPSGSFSSSRATGVRAGLQVGNASPIGFSRSQAIAWHGTAASWINLHFKLPAQYWTWSSSAWSVDNLGNIVGYVENPTHTIALPVIWLKS
jgi:hypothetical protein